MGIVLLVFCILCVATFIQACMMFVYAWEHSRYLGSRLVSSLKPATSLRVSLFVPCKGMDLDIENNLRALFEQQYPSFELCFVVESASEPVMGVIESLQKEFPQIPCRVVVAGMAAGCGQKVHNLISATRTLSEDTEVLAFVDSDACPHPFWLSRLIDRLLDRKYAVSTGYRWYAPRKLTWPNMLLSGMNNLINGLMGSHGFNLVWGGAWAIRVETFHKLGLPAAWQGSLSDDLVVSQLVHRAGLKVVYDPHCLVTSPAETTWPALAEFIRRQYLVVRVYAPQWWHAAFWTGFITNLTFFSSIALSVYLGIQGQNWQGPACGGFLIYVANACRMALGASAIRNFVKADMTTINSISRLNIWGWPIVAIANWLGLLTACVGRRIVWRGIAYRLVSSHETIIESHLPGTAEPRTNPRIVEQNATASVDGTEVGNQKDNSMKTRKAAPKRVA